MRRLEIAEIKQASRRKLMDHSKDELINIIRALLAAYDESVTAHSATKEWNKLYGDIEQKGV